MKVKMLIALVACIVLFSGGLLAPSLGMADDDPITSEEWYSMSEEERAAKREEMQAKWQSMTDEERAAKRAKMRDKWESMSYEEQAAQTRRDSNQMGNRKR